MLSCFHCGQEAADLEQHAGQSEPCARKALAFIVACGVTPLEGESWKHARKEHAAAIRRARARIAQARTNHPHPV